MQLAADKFVQDELVDRLNSINERLNTLRVENDEVKHKLIYLYVTVHQTHKCRHKILNIKYTKILLKTLIINNVSKWLVYSCGNCWQLVIPLMTFEA